MGGSTSRCLPQQSKTSPHQSTKKYAWSTKGSTASIIDFCCLSGAANCLKYLFSLSHTLVAGHQQQVSYQVHRAVHRGPCLHCLLHSRERGIYHRCALTLQNYSKPLYGWLHSVLCNHHSSLQRCMRFQPPRI